MKSLRDMIVERLINESISENDKSGIKKNLRNILLADGDEKNLKKLNQYMDILGIAIDGAYWKLTTPRYKATYEYVKDVDGGVERGGTTYVYIRQSHWMTNELVAFASDNTVGKKWIKKVEDALSLTPSKTTKDYIYYNVM